LLGILRHAFKTDDTTATNRHNMDENPRELKEEEEEITEKRRRRKTYRRLLIYL